MAVAIPLAIAATMATVNAAQASQRNSAIRRSMTSALNNQDVQSQQIDQKAQIQAYKQRNEAEMIRGRLRVAAAGSGGGEYANLLQQSDYDELLNKNILDTNIYNEQMNLRSGTEATLANLNASKANVGLSLITGGLQGLQTGLAIGSAINQYGANAATANAGVMNSPYGRAWSTPSATTNNYSAAWAPT